MKSEKRFLIICLLSFIIGYLGVQVFETIWLVISFGIVCILAALSVIVYMLHIIISKK